VERLALVDDAHKALDQLVALVVREPAQGHATSKVGVAYA
jgi:hypothetical protein